MAGRSRGPASDMSGGQEQPTEGEPKFAVEIGMLMDMGFQRSAVVAAIISSGGDVETAAAMLISIANGPDPSPPPSQISTSPTPTPSPPADYPEPTWDHSSTSTSTPSPPANYNAAAWGYLPMETPPQPTQRKAPALRTATNSGASLTAFHTYMDRPPNEEAVASTKSITATPKAGASVNPASTYCDDGYVEQPAHLTMIRSHKVQKCKITKHHETVVCRFWHTNRDRRRNPYEIPYTTTVCTDFPNCPEGDACMNAHSQLEVMFHPIHYKTSLCKARGPLTGPNRCTRDPLICAFCHGKDDSRHLNYRYNRASAVVARPAEDEMPALKPAPPALKPAAPPAAVKKQVLPAQSNNSSNTHANTVYANGGAYDHLADREDTEDSLRSVEQMLQQLRAAPVPEANPKKPSTGADTRDTARQQAAQPAIRQRAPPATAMQPPIFKQQSSMQVHTSTTQVNTMQVKAQPPTPPAPSPVVIALETIAPAEFLCPLTKRVMIDPVIAADGETYERQAIEQYLGNIRKQRKPYISPVTSERLPDADLTSNMAIKIMIDDFRLLHDEQ